MSKKMIIVDKSFVDGMKSLTVDEAIEIFSKGVFVETDCNYKPLYHFMAKALRMIGDMGAVRVLASNEIPKKLKEVIGFNIASWYSWNWQSMVFPKAAAYVARNGQDDAKMVFIAGCDTEMWLDVSINASDRVMKALVEKIQKRIDGLRGNYNYEGEIKAEIDKLRVLARAISLREDVSAEIREMAKYAAL